MARTVTVSHPLAQGVGAPSIQGTAIGALLLVLRPIAVAALAAAHFLVDAGCAWAENRRLRADERKLRELAAIDPRVAADLVALQQAQP